MFFPYMLGIAISIVLAASSYDGKSFGTTTQNFQELKEYYPGEDDVWS